MFTWRWLLVFVDIKQHLLWGMTELEQHTNCLLVEPVGFASFSIATSKSSGTKFSANTT